MNSFGENDQAQLALEEMAHRFFNSLQIIDSLLAGTIRDMGNEEAAIWGLHSIRGQVRTIFHFHRHVNLHERFGELLEGRCRSVCIDLVRCFGREDITPWVEMEEVDLEPGREERLLLLVVELMTNALKHSRADGRGIVWIDLRRCETGQLELRVRDNGAQRSRFDPGTKPRIADALARSLGGDLRVRVDSGFHVQVRFPATSPVAFASKG